MKRYKKNANRFLWNDLTEFFEFSAYHTFQNNQNIKQEQSVLNNAILTRICKENVIRIPQSDN